MNKKLSLFLVVIILCFSFTFVGCKDTKDNVIRLNEVTHSIFYAPQYLAMALGYFEEEGLEIELVNGGGSDNTMTAVLTGEADIGLSGPETTVYVYLQGKQDYPMIIGQLTKRDGSFLLSRENESNFDWSNLENKEILMGRRGGMPAMILQYILNKHGYVDGKNITMNYDIQFNMLAPSFTSGIADYVPLFEPVASSMAAQNKGYIVTGIGRESGEIPYTCYIASQDYISKNPDKIEGFLRAINRATMYLLTNDNQKIADLLLPYFEGTDKSLIVSALDNYKAYDTWVTDPLMTKDSFKRLQDILENAGELSQRVDYEALIYEEIASKIAK